jgi:nucleotidyltransferase substrate binding protein (TIGR01987 family)
MEPDTRWEQRFNNYKKALSKLQKFIDKGTLNELEEQGLIQTFEFTHELAWNVIKDYFQYQGANNIYGSRDATREAFQKGIIMDGDEWMEMIKSRNESSHTYHEETIKKIHHKIFTSYFDLFIEFRDKMQTLVV